VGAALVPRLRSEGHELRGLARDPASLLRDRPVIPNSPRRATGAAPPALPVIRGDVVTGEGLPEAFDGVDVAYFLVHSMEPSTDGPFADRERRAAENFAAAARAAGVRRVVYLGGLMPTGRTASPHLSSRLAVEETLMSASPASVALRASIAIGARSRSFRFLVRLVERVPVMFLPSWHSNRTQPIDERDMLEFLVRTATSPTVAGQSLDIAGPDVLSYGELIQGIAEAMMVARPALRLGVSVTPVASRVAAAIADEDPELILPLMESLEYDLVARNNHAAELLGVRLHSLDRAIEHALRKWEADEPLVAR
jgi:uncharacterized protein YbjT (DUF2867 family)